jgi:hypothetical protein
LSDFGHFDIKIATFCTEHVMYVINSTKNGWATFWANFLDHWQLIDITSGHPVAHFPRQNREPNEH